MKALTIQQPYAELIARGEKRVENRRWYASYRGPLAIHAGKGRDYLDLDPLGVSDASGLLVRDMAFGAIVATCELVACIPIRDIRSLRFESRFPWLSDHWHAEGPFCFILENINRLPQSIPCKGAQGLWDWKAEPSHA